ncbi:MAG TPA: hypothetical protein VGE15_00320 [Sphingobacteriaceae bacterium]
MKNSTKYFRVYLHQTSITEVPANDFKAPVKDRSKSLTPCYSLPSLDGMFYDYPDLIQAMEGAKKGALSYIRQLTRRAKGGVDELFQYRHDHYDDLNFKLTESNIRRLEGELKARV